MVSIKVTCFCICISCIGLFANCGITAYTEKNILKAHQEISNCHFTNIGDSINKYMCCSYEGISYKKTNRKKSIEYKLSKTRINKFYEYNVGVEAYKLKFENEDILIILGKAAGATGLGVDYWWYECYSKEQQEPIAEFMSLVRSPFSVYWDKKTNSIGYIEVTKDESYDNTKEFLVTIYNNGKLFFGFKLPADK